MVALHRVFTAVVDKHVYVNGLDFIQLLQFDLACCFCFGQIGFIDQILKEKFYIMQICQPRHWKHIPFQISKISPQIFRKLAFQFFTFEINVVFFFYDVVRLVTFVVNFYLFFSHVIISSMASSSEPNSLIFSHFISS